MPASGKVYICHAAEDTARCASLLQALSTWHVDYFFDATFATLGQPLSQQTQMAIAECDVFLRICSRASQRSYWVNLETGAFLSLQAEEHRTGQPSARRLVNLVIDREYQRQPFDSGSTLIDTTRMSYHQWMDQLRAALGVVESEGSDAVAVSFEAEKTGISRRRFVGVGVGAVAVLAAAGATGALVLSRQSASERLHSTPLLPTPTPTATPPKVRDPRLAHWFRTGDKISASIVLGKGVVYAASQDKYIYALDSTTLSEVWRLPTGATNYVAPALVNGVLYAAPAEGSVIAINASTGQQEWAKGTAMGFSTPVVVEGLVYVSGYGFPTPSLVWCLDSTGKDVKTNSSIGYSTSTPLVTNTAIYVGSSEPVAANTFDGHLVALDANDLHELWRVHTGQIVVSSPVLGNGLIYIGSTDNNLYAIDPQTQAVRWTFPTGGVITSTPLIANGVVYFGSLDTSVYAVDATMGKQVWKYPTGKSIRSSATLADGVLYIGSDDADVYALDPTAGTVVRKYQTGGSVLSTPVVANGLLYVGSEDTYVYAFHV